MNLCVIPARGGSKRIPKKNIKFFCGKPIILWSIEEAIKSKCFEKIIVSTDDEEIANLVKSHGIDVPFMRPKELSDDYTETIPVIAHAIRHQIKHNQSPSKVCCIYAAAPFIRANDLKLCFEKLDNCGAEFTFPATSYAYPIQRSFRINKNQRAEMFQPKHSNSRSQDLEEAYHDAGQFYWGKVNAWLENNSIINENASPILLPRYRVQDIDTPEDWQKAEIMFKAINENKL
ncbi:pseudaminic acid cytidylyltransferase [Candidatus Pelagibacter sp.]|jgi:pseudaminic acid cytidylyltransferase|nr:pseudaminic acid cytidylyltransferase [Candidatus Pelagibacter sp.]